MTMALTEYQAKRDFRKTPEPAGKAGKPHRRPIFVVQEHHASRLHYDFRLEADGVLKSWAVPKQPSLDPGQKRLAVRVEDHPLAYATFQGTIPAGQSGAGTVAIWDHGTYDNLLKEKAVPQSVTEGIDAGRLEFALHGDRLEGRFALLRMNRRGKDNWLLIKMKDEFARPESAGTKKPILAKTAPRATKAAARVSSRSAHSSASQDVTLTHPEKILFPEAGFTKEDVFQFYRRIARRLLPYLHDRPVTLERLPEGVGGADKPHFWQKNTPPYYPSWIPRVELPTERGKVVPYTLVNDLPTLLYLVNQGALTFHVWFSRVQALDRPDFVLFDLDPGDAPFADLVAVARRLHTELSAQGHEAFVKTSGKTGLHILVPWQEEGGYDKARAWALQVSQRVAEAEPDRATTEIRKAKREGRVYLDVMQNAKGHHAVPPYVLRAVPQAAVSTPLHWHEVTPELDPTKFNLKTIVNRLARQKTDPLAALAGELPR
jgi:bifunctional non-homologous end joining protein LigD